MSHVIHAHTFCPPSVADGGCDETAVGQAAGLPDSKGTNSKVNTSIYVYIWPFVFLFSVQVIVDWDGLRKALKELRMQQSGYLHSLQQQHQLKQEIWNQEKNRQQEEEALRIEKRRKRQEEDEEDRQRKLRCFMDGAKSPKCRRLNRCHFDISNDCLKIVVNFLGFRPSCSLMRVCKSYRSILQGYLAYVNEQNIEAFLDTFSENVRYIRLEVFL